MEFRKGDKLEIRAKRNLPGEGLDYGAFTGYALEDGCTGGWDVYDVSSMPENDNKDLSVYGFSIEKINDKTIDEYTCNDCSSVDLPCDCCEWCEMYPCECD